MAALAVVPAALLPGREGEAVRRNALEVPSVAGNGQTYLLALMVVCPGVEEIPEPALLDHRGRFDALSLPLVLRLEEGPVRRDEGPFVRAVIAAVGSFRHAKDLDLSGLFAGGEHQDHLSAELIYLGVDGAVDAPGRAGDEYGLVAGVRENQPVLAGGVPDIVVAGGFGPPSLVKNVDGPVEKLDARCHGSPYPPALGVPQLEVARPCPVDEVGTDGYAGMPAGLPRLERGAQLALFVSTFGIIHVVRVLQPYDRRVLGKWQRRAGRVAVSHPERLENDFFRHP